MHALTLQMKFFETSIRLKKLAPLVREIAQNLVILQRCSSISMSTSLITLQLIKSKERLNFAQSLFEKERISWLKP